jgi:hypothetical protein
MAEDYVGDCRALAATARARAMELLMQAATLEQAADFVENGYADATQEQAFRQAIDHAAEMQKDAQS